MDKDVTKHVIFENNDDESLPLLKCICGKEFKYWDFILSIYSDDNLITPCPNCGRKFYFRNKIIIYEKE